MPAETPLIAIIAAGLGLAFLLGMAAQRLRIPPLIGYLAAGVAVGPFTPGYVADAHLAHELAELGVILLMFGVGLHFSLKSLMAVRAIAIPGAMAQIAAATLLGMGLAWLMGWGWGAGLLFGLALSVASTVVLLKAMQDRRLIDTPRGQIAVGWLIVEDLAMVLALVLIPALAPALTSGGEALDWRAAGMALLVTVGKVAAFIALMLLVGRRVIPWTLHYTAHTGSRELFRLAVLAIALGVAFAATHVFGVSLALGAFFAGMVLAESQLSQRAAEETLPLRDAFAVLFFVAVGMLFDPLVIVREPLPVLAVLLIITVGKSLAAFAIVRLFRHPASTALTISASLAQIGEFSFILASLGVSLSILPEEGRDLILAGAMLSIVLNPLVFALADRVAPAVMQASGETGGAAPHTVLIGAGRVGAQIVATLKARGAPFLVIDLDAGRTAALKAQGVDAFADNAARPGTLELARLGEARRMIVAVPDVFEAGRIVQEARRLAPDLEIVARARDEAEARHLTEHGATTTVIGYHELARGLLNAIRPPKTAAAKH